MEKNLHIINFSVPYPVDYGGAFDLFYKLEALQKKGVKIHLHCFDYGRGRQPALNAYCENVHYYQRNTGWNALLSKQPYIVESRNNEELFSQLLKDDYPILMEGIHSTYLLTDKRFEKRRKFVRIHNVEYSYYQQLATNATALSKKIFYWWESKKLYNYEMKIANKATAFWGVTTKDVVDYRTKFACKNIDYLPLYLPEWKVKGLPGMGTYCLYQADLSVECNEKAAIWLIEKVFGELKIPLVVAGKNPSKKLAAIAHKDNHTCLVANPGHLELNDMIAKAHINVLPSFNNSGIKLKLLNALYNGRYCLVNETMVEGTNLAPTCIIANDVAEMKEAILAKFNMPYNAENNQLREQLLYTEYSNSSNAAQMVQWIWGNTYR